MGSGFITGLAESLSGQIQKGSEQRRETAGRKSKRSESLDFIKQLEDAGIPIEQLAGAGPEGTFTTRAKSSPDLSSIMFGLATKQITPEQALQLAETQRAGSSVGSALSQFGIGGGSQELANLERETRPISGAASENTFPSDVTKIQSGGVTVEQTPGEQGRREGIRKAEAQTFENARKLIGAVKNLSTITEQFNRAIPTDDRTPIEQRIFGTFETIGAELGIKPNPDLKSLLTTRDLEAVQLIRSFGEVGNLAREERRLALQPLLQERLTEKERSAVVRDVIERALAKNTSQVRNFILEDADVRNIVQKFGVRMDIVEGSSKVKAGTTGTTKSGLKFEVIE